MAELIYQRQFRTPNSESYIIQRDGKPFGHLDLHFGATEVSGTLILLQEQPDEALLKLVDQIDEDLVVIVRHAARRPAADGIQRYRNRLLH